MADFYNRTLQRRGEVNTFSIVKFRHKTNGTVNTEEFGVPANIKTDQPWIAEAPVGDWFYAPGFTYNSGMMIRYIIEAIARDGNAALCISILPDGSLDEGSLKMLKEVGVWMRRNGEAVYGSHAWTIPGEGEIVNGKLKMLPGGELGRKHAEFKFDDAGLSFYSRQKWCTLCILYDCTSTRNTVENQITRYRCKIPGQTSKNCEVAWISKAN